MTTSQVEIVVPIAEATNPAIHQLVGQTTQVKRTNETHPWRATIQAAVHDKAAHTLALRLAVDIPPPIDPQGWELVAPLRL